MEIILIISIISLLISIYINISVELTYYICVIKKEDNFTWKQWLKMSLIYTPIVTYRYYKKLVNNEDYQLWNEWTRYTSEGRKTNMFDYKYKNK